MSNIHQEIVFAAPAARVYRALVNPAELAKATGAPAEGVEAEGAPSPRSAATSPDDTSSSSRTS